MPVNPEFLAGENTGLLLRNVLVPNFETGRLETLDLLVRAGAVVSATPAIHQATESLGNPVRSKVSAVNSALNHEFSRESGGDGADGIASRCGVPAIDASGLVASPGFVDPHSHFDLACFDPGWAGVRLAQGITSEVVGNCGMSVFPLSPVSGREWLEAYRGVWGGLPEDLWMARPRLVPGPRGLGRPCETGTMPWADGAGYASALEDRPPGSAMVTSLLGYSAVRFLVTGMEDRPLTADELALARRMVEEELDRGAPGVTIGIGYPPGLYAGSGEYAMVCAALGRRGKPFVTHIRDEGDRVVEALQEVLEYAETGGCPLHVSHLKCFGRANHWKAAAIFEWIGEASRRVDLSFDVHPYDSGSTTLNSLLPPDVLGRVRGNWEILLDPVVLSQVRKAIDKGLAGWENYGGVTGFDRVVPLGLANPDNFRFEGVSLSESASSMGLAPAELACRLIASERGGASMAMFSMEESTVLDLLCHPKAMAGSDGLYNRRPHPRTAGAFPRFLRRAVRETGRLDLVAALRKITLAPAERFGLRCKPEDMVIFDPATIADGATFADPFAPPAGIEAVVCGGRLFKGRRLSQEKSGHRIGFAGSS